MLSMNSLETESSTAGYLNRKPDPERMLQEARAEKEGIQNEIESFIKFRDYYYDGSEGEQMKMLGAMTRLLYQAKDREQFWLKEIDNG